MIFVYYGFILLGLGVAVFFQVLFLKQRRGLLLVCSLLWLVPIGYETWVLGNCTGECNIRVDLLYVFPAEVIVLTSMSLLAWLRHRKRQIPN